MTGTMMIGKLKKKAAYYYQQDYDERVGGHFIFFIEPLCGNDGECFYYVRKLSDGKLEITGEAYIIIPERLTHYMRAAREKLGGKYPIYYWQNENGDIAEIATI